MPNEPDVDLARSKIERGRLLLVNRFGKDSDVIGLLDSALALLPSPKREEVVVTAMGSDEPKETLQALEDNPAPAEEPEASPEPAEPPPQARKGHGRRK